MEQKTKLNTLDRFFVIAFFGFIPLLWTDSTFDPNEHLQFLASSILMAIFWLREFFQKKDFVLYGKSSVLFFGATVLYLLYSLFNLKNAFNFSDGLFIYLKLLLCSFFALTVYQLRDKENLFPLIVSAVSTCALAVCLPSFYQFFNLAQEDELVIPKSTYLIKSIFAHRNLFVEYLVLCLPFSVYGVLSQGQKSKILYITSIVLSVFWVVLLSNRTAWLCLLLIALITFVSFLTNKSNISIQKIWKLGLMFAISGVLGFVTIISFSKEGSLKEHTLSSWDKNQGSTKDRLGLWKRSFEMIKKDPVVGIGLDSWKIEILNYGHEGMESELNNSVFQQRPHNDFIWVCVEQGVIGLIFYLFILLLPVFVLLRSIVRARETRSQAFLFLSVLLVYLLIAQLSFPKERISHNVFFFGIAAYGLSTMSLAGNRLINYKWVWALLPMIFAAIYVGYQRFDSDVHFKKAVFYKMDSDFQSSLLELEQAKSKFYTLDETSTPMNWYLGLANFNLANLDGAATAFENSLKENPYHIYTLNDYGTCLAQLGKADKAIENYKKAINLSPTFVEARLNLAVFYFQKSDFNSSFELLKTINSDAHNDRFQKVLRAVIVSVLNDAIKKGSISSELKDRFIKEQNNQKFYQEILRLAIRNKLKASELPKK